ncbi:hypothetical protein KA005_66635 [bacterium]|nr:hypothetical protein [bacterium]
MCRFYIASCDPENWRPFLADPEKHWKKGYSARALAYSWTDTNDFPPEVKKAFNNCDEKQLRNIELLLGFPEYQIPLPGGSKPSQNDLFLLAKAEDSLVSITIEGKVSESFDETVNDWLKDASEGKKQRLDYLCNILDLDINQVRDIRYQLLHRTASALIEATRFNAKYAIMLVHSFSQINEGLEDYQNFVALYGCEARINEIHHLTEINKVKLFAGWITGDMKFLTK